VDKKMGKECCTHLPFGHFFLYCLEDILLKHNTLPTQHRKERSEENVVFLYTQHRKERSEETIGSIIDKIEDNIPEMDLSRCTCGTLIGAFRDAYKEYKSVKTLHTLKEHGIEPKQLWIVDNINSDKEFYEFIGIKNPCCRVHMKNYFDPIMYLKS
jgi:DNA-directed RNA polymerase subunit N (RpoN/RPB10)